MRRNQPARSKRTPAGSPSDAARTMHEVPSLPAKTEPPPRETSIDSSADVRRVPVGLLLLVCLVAVVVVFCGLIALFLSMRWRAEWWPTTGDVGIMPLAGVAGAGLLLLASVAAWFARRGAQAGNRLLARLCLALTLVCAICFALLRGYEYRELYAVGIWQRSAAGPIHERPDIYYLQAVRFRLADLFQELDTRRVDQPTEYTDEDAERLELVTELQANMVNWTEHEVGHWSDDLQQRRAAMELVAYQIHPLARNQGAVTTNVQEQLRELERQSPWFNILYEYCREKSALLDGKRPSSPADPQGAAAVQPEDAGSPDAGALAELDRELNEKLNTLGLADWSYAASVMLDTSDLAMTGERLNQIAARVQAMEARAAFLNDLQVLEHPETDGLNRKYPWLRLPICLPGGNAWASGYFVLTGLHLLLLGAAVVLSAGVLLLRRDPVRVTRWRHVQRWWYATSLIGVALVPLFYLF